MSQKIKPRQANLRRVPRRSDANEQHAKLADLRRKDRRLKPLRPIKRDIPEESGYAGGQVSQTL